MIPKVNGKLANNTATLRERKESDIVGSLHPNLYASNAGSTSCVPFAQKLKESFRASGHVHCTVVPIV